MAAERLIVVGMDGSTDGRRALAWAVEHARSSGASVQAVTAYSWFADWTYAAGSPEEQKQEVINRQNADIDVVLAGCLNPPEISRLVVEGDPVDVLTRAAVAADMLVLGSHGHGRVASVLLGSTAAGCIRRGCTPVLVVPSHTPADHADAVVPTAGTATV